MAKQDLHTESDADTQERLGRVLTFARANKHSPLYAAIPEVGDGSAMKTLEKCAFTDAEWLGEHKDALSHYPDSEVRYIVSEFDSERHKELFLPPQRVSEVWRTLQHELSVYHPRVAILSVPLFWQMGPMFYHTCKDRGVPVSVVSPRNAPLMVQLIKEVGAEMVVATPEAAAAVFELLQKEGLEEQIRIWHLIVPANSHDSIPELSGDVSVEHHALPGIPVGYTEPKPHAEISSVTSFSTLDEYYYEIIDGKCYITSLDVHAIPLIRFRILENAKVKEDQISYE